jgi:hypothetical protein
MENFRHYLLGSKFILRTDHKALTDINRVENPTGKLIGWALKLQEFDFIAQYIKG